MSTDVDAEPSPYVRTTVTLREDLYQRLREGGKGISEELNRILAREFERDHSMFGTAKRMRTDDLRDHADRV